jgi:hypothetical protein
MMHVLLEALSLSRGFSELRLVPIQVPCSTRASRVSPLLPFGGLEPRSLPVFGATRWLLCQVCWLMLILVVSPVARRLAWKERWVGLCGLSVCRAGLIHNVWCLRLGVLVSTLLLHTTANAISSPARAFETHHVC